MQQPDDPDPGRLASHSFEDVMHHMHRLSKSLPGEDLWVEAAQMLAELVEHAADRLTDEEIGTIIGAGALMCRQGFREFQANGLLQNFVRKAARGGEL